VWIKKPFFLFSEQGPSIRQFIYLVFLGSILLLVEEQMAALYTTQETIEK